MTPRKFQSVLLLIALRTKP